MRENNSNGVGALAIELDQLIEGDQVVSWNYRFAQIGQPVPIIPGNDDSLYDPQTPPSNPLAVSEHFRLLFVAHSDGFYVARTKEVMALAEDIKDKRSSLSSIHDLSILNLSIGKVSILALSSGDSLLAASVENHLHFFSISALLHKEKEPSFSVCIDDLSCIKDVKWSRKAEKDYVVLSGNGKLYHGYGQASPSNVMVNVDAVEWSAKGDFVAVARKNVLSILSSQFTEKLSFSLPSTSVIVDSVKWVHAESIVLGCFEAGDDSEQASYLVHVITIQDLETTDASSKPVVLSFSDVFLDYRSDVVPGASGPNLFLSYLDHYELAFIGNRKNLAQHVVLLGWSLDDKKNEAATIELPNDVWCAHIESQDNGDDNLVLALSVDKVSQNEEIKFILGEEETEVSPCCILVCLTIDGKISLFHFASAAVPTGSPEVLPDSSSQEDASPQMLPEHAPSKISSNIREQDIHVSLGLESDESIRVEPHRIQGDDFVKENSQQFASIKNNLVKHEEKPPISFRTLNVINEEISSGSKPKSNQDRGSQQFISAEKPRPKTEHFPLKTFHLEAPGIEARDLYKTETQALSEVIPNADSLSGKGLTDLSSHSVTKELKACGNQEFQEKNVPKDLRIASPSWSTGKSTVLTNAEERLSSLSASIFDKKSSGIPDRNILHSAGAPFQSPSRSNVTTGSAVEIYSSRLKATTITGDVEVMVKKMDQLLEAIGGYGGFKDASITSQEGSLVALEEGLWTISERCRTWRGVLESRLREIQILLDKTVQVLARKTYMNGIFQQATDNWYWDLWNCQKLSAELELKRQHIVEVDQDLTTQLVELERHFNTIEFNKFGKSNVIQTTERTINSHWNSRQQSLKSLHNTIGAQLAAAEKLSECLFKQMAALSIEPPKKQNAKRDIFETLGLTYDGASYSTPGNGKASDTTRRELLTASSSVVTAKEQQSWRNQCTPGKSSESENVRRRRDSLDPIWLSSKPPKTTLKRTFLPILEHADKDFRPIQQSEVHLYDAPSISERFPAVSTTSSKNSVEVSKSSYREVGSSKSAMKEVKQTLITTDSCVSDSNYKASVSPPTPIGSSPCFSQKILHSEMQSISSLTSQFNLSSTTSASLSKPNAAASSPAMLSDKFSSFSDAKVDADRKVSPHRVVSSSLISPSALSFPTPKKDGRSSATHVSISGNSESLESGSQPLVGVFGSTRDGNSTKQSMSTNSILASGESPNTPSSVSQPGSNSTSNLHIEPTVPPRPVPELPASLKSENQLNIGGMSSPASEPALNAKLEQPWLSRIDSPVGIFSGIPNNGKNGSPVVANGDEMEEEAPEGSPTTELALGNLGGFTIGSTPNSTTVVKPNPFGVEMLNKAATPLSSPFTVPTPSGELFRPASFNFQSPLPSQPSQPANIGAFSSGFNTGSTSQGPTASGFGQPAQFGSGQQALGSVLGAFGQTRQLGASPPRTGVAPPSGFASGLFSMSTGGFGGGYSTVASAGGGFASMATSGGVGGFGAAATAGGGFAAAATGGAGFTSGGFGAFSNQGGGGFSSFASGSGAGRPPSELFTQMRK